MSPPQGQVIPSTLFCEGQMRPAIWLKSWARTGFITITSRQFLAIFGYELEICQNRKEAHLISISEHVTLTLVKSGTSAGYAEALNFYLCRQGQTRRKAGAQSCGPKAFTGLWQPGCRWGVIRHHSNVASNGATPGGIQACRLVFYFNF